MVKSAVCTTGFNSIIWSSVESWTTGATYFQEECKEAAPLRLPACKNVYRKSLIVGVSIIRHGRQGSHVLIVQGWRRTQ